MSMMLVAVVLAALLLVAGIFVKKPKRPRKSQAERDRAIAEMLASAQAMARNAKQSPDETPVMLKVSEPVMVEPESKSPAVVYRDRSRLLDDTERELYRRLVEALPALRVFAQVSPALVFGPELQMENGREAIEFVVCRTDDTRIVAAIEFNQSPQQVADERQRAFAMAGIALIVLNPDDLPDVVSLRRMIAPHVVRG